MLNKSTLDWLNQNLISYSSPSYCLNQITAVLTTFPSIQPKTDFYPNNNNSNSFTTQSPNSRILLIYMTGTIPVIYRNNQYYFPIEIILPLDYPSSKPLIRIIALEGMRLREGRLIRNGKLVHPVLERWEGRELVEVLRVLQRDFGVDPPLEAVVQQLKPPTYTQSPMLPPRGGYNPTSGATNLPYTMNTSSTAYTQGGNSSYTNPNNNLNSKLPPPASFSYVPQPQQSKTHQPASNVGFGQGQTLAAPKTISQESIDRQALQLKVSSSLQILLDEYARDTSAARSRGDLLRRNEEGLKGLQEYYTGVIGILQTNSEKLLKAIDQVQDYISTVKQMPNVDIDSLKAPDPISDQLVELVAEVNTCNDLAYYLNKGYHPKVTRIYSLKEIRKIGREVFMKKVLIRKILSMA